jgi:hypothetical protein
MSPIIYLFTFSLLLLGCSTVQKPPQKTVVDKKFKKSTKAVKVVRTYSVHDVEKRLAMGRRINDLGFKEKSFDPCKLGLSQSGCGKKVFVSLNLQISCRDSEGTTEEIAELTPMNRASISWKILGRKGSAETDRDGYVQIRALFNRLIKNQRVILLKDKLYLGIRTQSYPKLVLPRNWCM